MEPVLDKLRPGIDERARRDSAAEDLSSILRVYQVVERTVLEELPPEDGVAAIGDAVETFATRDVVRQVAQVITVDRFAPLDLVMGNWVEGNVALIRTIDSRYFADVQRVITQGITEGRLTSDVMSDLMERFDVSKGRAELIARDQIGKLNGQITQNRQANLGITRYVWSASRDGRVRPLHDELDGTVQEWANPPICMDNGERGHPGEAIQCRCVPIAVLPGDDIEGLE
jgi:SPP1 gp7 family putative phage head morphogenesis protein